MAGERPRRRSVGWTAGAGRGWAIGLSLSAFGGRTTTAIPGGQAGYGDGYTWLKMANNGCDWLRYFSGLPRRRQGGGGTGPTDARIDGRRHGDCLNPQKHASMKTKARVRVGIFTTTDHETLVWDKRLKRSSRSIGSVPQPEVSRA